MEDAVQQDTDVADPKVGADKDSVNAAKQAKKELARQEREAAREAKRQEREADKAALKEAKAKAKADVDALKSATKEKQERLKREKEEAKLTAADQKFRDEQALKSDVDAAAVEIHAGDESIRKYDRMSTPEAEKIGIRLIDIKPKLKLIKPKIRFKTWIETICGILYRRANNYMRVAQAIAEDESLRDMGLTELYEHLGLVTRTRKKAGDGDAGDGDGAGDGDASKRKPDVAVGPLTARWFGGSYVMNLGADWRKALHKAIDDPNFATVIQDRGTLIRLAANK